MCMFYFICVGEEAQVIRSAPELANFEMERFSIF